MHGGAATFAVGNAPETANAQPISVDVFVYRNRRPAALGRRVADIALGTLGFACALPVLTLAAAAIVLDDGLPITFVQRRVGRFGRTFSIFKLRTMRKDTGDGRSPTAAGDRRVTRAGAILRRLSIDELPQLLNVIRGEMSLVGPRPEMPFIVRSYEPWQHLRHLVKPGLTCLWQVSHRSTVPLERPEATALDLDYIANASPALDALLVAKTFGAVIRPRGAY
ncbi:MAG: sugar transferase [Stellaceae bacterium]